MGMEGVAHQRNRRALPGGPENHNSYLPGPLLEWGEMRGRGVLWVSLAPQVTAPRLPSHPRCPALKVVSRFAKARDAND